VDSLGSGSTSQRVTQAVLLAAGLGSRLGQRTEALPKGLIRVGDTSLLGRSVKLLRASGVERFIVVGGHRNDVLRNALSDALADKEVEWIVNADYAETGSAASLDLAIPSLTATEGALVAESDIIYHPRFLDLLWSSNDQIAVADPSGSGDEVYVYCDGSGDLSYMGKGAESRDGREPVGEFAGLSVITPETRRIYAERLRSDPESGKRHYEEVFVDLASDGLASFAVKHHPGLPWSEVDTEEDLERVESKIVPDLQGGDPA